MSRILVNRFATAAALGLLCTGISSPGAAEETALIRAVNTVRAQGCGRRDGVEPALRHDGRLDEAARNLAAGRRLKDAMQTAGYRAVQVAVLEAAGSPAAIERNLAQGGCKDITDPVYRDVGANESERGAWIVLAAPLLPPAAGESQAVGRRVLELVNAARSEKRRCGWKRYDAAPPLAPSAALERAAAAHARDMAARGVMSHSGSDGSTTGQRATRAGYAWSFVGENVASGQATPELVVAEWIGSPHHCANLMSADFTEMGVAFAADPKSPAGIYWAQVFGAPAR